MSRSFSGARELRVGRGHGGQRRPPHHRRKASRPSTFGPEAVTIPHVQDPDPCLDLEHRRRPRCPRRGLRRLVLPALSPRRRRPDRADAGEVLRLQPCRGEFLQQDPGERPLGAQGLLRVRRAPEHPEQGHRLVRAPLLRSRAPRVPAAPGPQRARLPQPRVLPARPQDPRPGQRGLCDLLRRILRGMGIFPQLDRAHGRHVLLQDGDRAGLRGEEGDPPEKGPGCGAT